MRPTSDGLVPDSTPTSKAVADLAIFTIITVTISAGIVVVLRLLPSFEWPPSNPLLYVPLVLASWAPNIAAAIVLLSSSRGSELLSLISQWGRWRVGVTLYAIGLVGPFLIGLFVVAAFVGVGSVGDALPRFAALIIPSLVVGIFTGPLGKELGWRGFALGRLRHLVPHRAAPLVLSGIVIAFHAPGWFVPNFYASAMNPWSHGVLLVALTTLCSGVYLLSGKSLLLATLTHSAINTAVGLLILSIDVDGTTFLWLACGMLAFGLVVHELSVRREQSVRHHPAS